MRAACAARRLSCSAAAPRPARVGAPLLRGHRAARRSAACGTASRGPRRRRRRRRPRRRRRARRPRRRLRRARPPTAGECARRVQVEACRGRRSRVGTPRRPSTMARLHPCRAWRTAAGRAARRRASRVFVRRRRHRRRLAGAIRAGVDGGAIVVLGLGTRRRRRWSFRTMVARWASRVVRRVYSAAPRPSPTAVRVSIARGARAASSKRGSGGRASRSRCRAKQVADLSAREHPPAGRPRARRAARGAPHSWARADRAPCGSAESSAQIDSGGARVQHAAALVEAPSSSASRRTAVSVW